MASADASSQPLGQKISAYRKKRNLTMQQLAEAVGVSESYISFLESGVRSPSRKLLKKLVSFFYPQGHPALLDEWLLLAGFSPEQPLHLSASVTVELTEPDAGLSGPKAAFARLRQLIKQGELIEARERIQEGLQQFNSSIEMQSLIGTLELAHGRYDNAIQAQETALSFYQQNPDPQAALDLTDLYLSLGVSWFMKGYADLNTYHQGLAEGAEERHLRRQRRAAEKAFVAARTQYETALSHDPEDIYIWDEYARVQFNLAHLLGGSKRWKDALQAYQKVLRHRDNRVMGAAALLEAALFYAHAHSQLGQFERAEELLMLLQAIRPEYWLGHYARACLLSLQSASADASAAETALNEAFEHLSRAVRLAPQPQAALQEALQDPDLAALRALHGEALEALLPPEALRPPAPPAPKAPPDPRAPKRPRGRPRKHKPAGQA